MAAIVAGAIAGAMVESVAFGGAATASTMLITRAVSASTAILAAEGTKFAFGDELESFDTGNYVSNIMANIGVGRFMDSVGSPIVEHVQGFLESKPLSAITNEIPNVAKKLIGKAMKSKVITHLEPIVDNIVGVVQSSWSSFIAMSEPINIQDDSGNFLYD